eukprot:2235539-Pleurochrysis_carterae.AAC.2
MRQNPGNIDYFHGNWNQHGFRLWEASRASYIRWNWPVLPADSPRAPAAQRGRRSLRRSGHSALHCSGDQWGTQSLGMMFDREFWQQNCKAAPRLGKARLIINSNFSAMIAERRSAVCR